MKTLLLIDILLLAFIAFVDWLFPEVRKKTKGALEEWWIRFVDLDYQRTGPAIAGRISQRIDESVGESLFAPRFLVGSVVFSLSTFLVVFVWISLAWGLTAPSVSSTLSVLGLLIARLGHAWAPIIAIDVLFDLASLVITRHVLRSASAATAVKQYLLLIGIDSVVAVALALINTLFVGNFYFAPDLPTALALFVVYISLAMSVLGALFIVILGVGVLVELMRRRESDFGWGGLFGLSLLVAVLSFPAVIAFRDNFYLSHLSFDTRDLAIVFLMASAATAIVPTLMNLALNILLFFLSLLARPFHAFVSRLLLRLAETDRSVLYFLLAVLTVGKDVIRLMAR